MITQEFRVQLRPQKEWGGLIDVAFFLGGTGGGLFVVSLFIGFYPGLLLALLSGALACVALVLDLGHPERFARVLLRPNKSWLSRGSLFLTAFLVLGILYIAPSLGWLAWLPWSDRTVSGKIIGIVTAVAALGVVIYSGMAMSHSPSIPSWNTALLPILISVYAFVSGLAAVFVALAVTGSVGLDVRPVVASEMLLIVVSMVFVAAHYLVMSHSTLSARESVRLLTTGRSGRVFLGGGVVVGSIAPLALLGYVYFMAPADPLGSAGLAVAGVLTLLGVLLLRFSFLKAGVYVSPA